MVEWKWRNARRLGQFHYVALNLLERDFVAEASLQKLVTDMTYLPYGNKMSYLSSIKDRFNDEIIVDTNADHQDVSRVLDTLRQLALELKEAILHSDQGWV